MATVDIKISQSVVDLGNQLNSGATDPSANGSIGAVVDFLVANESAINSQYTSYSSYSIAGSTLTITFPDGATQVYTGVALSDGPTGTGTGTASAYSFYKDGVFQYEKSGSYNFSYAVASDALTFTTGASTNNSATYTGLAADADPNLGNTSFGYTGALHVDTAGAITGTITSMTESADKYVQSSVITGNFKVTGDVNGIAEGTSQSSVTGIMTSFHSDYYDGSHEYIDGLTDNLAANATVDETLLANPALFPGNDVITLNLPEHLYSTLLMASGAGNDTISLAGGGGLLNVDAGSGNDLIVIVSDHHQINGGDGVDTVQYAGKSTAYTVTQNSSGALSTVADGTGSDTLFNVERLQFSNVTVAFDITGNAGEAYRMYAAAFARTPDQVGLGFWVNSLDKGIGLGAMAADFVKSAEFVSLYGSNTSDTTFITNLYKNVLHRAPDAGGAAFWLDSLQQTSAHGATSRGDVLASFSESPENQAQVIGAIQHGITYIHYG
jgi:hypothetical protein